MVRSRRSHWSIHSPDLDNERSQKLEHKIRLDSGHVRHFALIQIKNKPASWTPSEQPIGLPDTKNFISKKLY